MFKAGGVNNHFVVVGRKLNEIIQIYYIITDAFKSNKKNWMRLTGQVRDD